MISTRLSCTSAFAAAVVLAACQGNVGNGGLSIPQAPAYNNPQGPGGATTASRQRVVEGAVTLAAGMNEVPLPAVDGFSIALELGTPPPASPSPAPSSSPTARARVGAFRFADAAEAATLPPSASPAPAASPSPSPGASAAAGGASQAPAATSSGAAASPSPVPSGAAKIATKTTVYPDDAPAAPTPQPSGNVQTFAKRTAIVRGYVEAGSPIPLYGLGAIRFTIPSEEAKSGRGFTVAVFTGRKHHETLVASDANAAIAGSVVAASATEPLVLKKATAYAIVLYGDELPATPAPVSSGYPSPGTNPFATPVPGGAPGQSISTFTPGAPASTTTPLPQ